MCWLDEVHPESALLDLLDSLHEAACNPILRSNT